MSKNQEIKKTGCEAGEHPRDKVFTWAFIHHPGFQSIINMGGVVAGCTACRKTYVVKAPASMKGGVKNGK